MKKKSFWEKLRYAFDNFMGKGTAALIGMLFLITAAVVVIAGTLSAIGNSDPTSNLIWASLMHAIDAGTLAGDDTSQTLFIIMMSIVTICGIFVTSILIGIISSGFEEKLTNLRKGFSRVIETKHTVIIGFNDSIYTILTELIEANANHKNSRILVIGTAEKEVMDEEIRSHVKDLKTTKIICRSGNAFHSTVLEMASVETARSIIINETDDFSIIKILLSVTTYLKSKNAFESASIATIMQDEANLEAARIAGEGKVEIIYFKDMLARVIANTCRQPGLSSVLTEIFGFAGDEFYFESFPSLIGKKFGEVLNLFRYSTVVGLCKNGQVLLNPPMDTLLETGDRIIHLAQDDGVSTPDAQLPVLSLEGKRSVCATAPEPQFDLLILGHNPSLPLVLRELDDFLSPSSTITIACDSLPEDIASWSDHENLSIATQEVNIYDRSVLENLLQSGVKNILLLSDSDISEEDADARSLLLLLQIRAIAAAWGCSYNITSQMNSVDNQKLLQVANVNDFVVGSSITNLMLVQIAENRELTPFFVTLLTSEGSELYMKDVQRYVQPGIELSFYELTELVKEKNEIFLGYKKTVDGRLTVTINPDKAEHITFCAEDSLIVVAED